MTPSWREVWKRFLKLHPAITCGLAAWPTTKHTFCLASIRSLFPLFFRCSQKAKQGYLSYNSNSHTLMCIRYNHRVCHSGYETESVQGDLYKGTDQQKRSQPFILWKLPPNGT